VVDIVRNSNGQVIGRSFTNGCDKNNPQRRGWYEKALNLNRSSPLHPLRKTLSPVRERRRAGDGRQKQIEPAAFISGADRSYFQRHGERMWLWVYKIWWHAYVAEGECKKAWNTLQAFHHFEPEFYNPRGLVQDFEHIRNRSAAAPRDADLRAARRDRADY
jgi:hypothetical protein